MKNVVHATAVAIVLASVGAAQLAPTCEQPPVSIAFLARPGVGWDVSFAKEAREISRGPYLLNGGKDNSGLTAIAYDVKKLVITLPHIEINRCDDTGTLRDLYLMPEQVIGFEKNGHLFAYQVWMQSMSGPQLDSRVLGSNMHVIFYDMHGDGIFDAVRIASGVGMPLVPVWVEKAPHASIKGASNLIWTNITSGLD